MYKGKRILCVIPARIGSKGLKQKNIKKFHGKPLLHFAIQASTNAELVDKVILSTDSEKISDSCKEFDNLEIVFRPKELSDDLATSASVLDHVLKTEKSKKLAYDVIIIVQVTNPLVISEDISNTVKLHIDSQADTCYSVVRIENFTYNKYFRMDENADLKRYIIDENINKSRQSFPSSFIRNGSCYSFLTANIHGDTFFEGRTVGYEVPIERYVDIDNQLDFDIAHFLYNRLSKKRD